MNVQEKTFARILFKNKILGAIGQNFEDIFTSIMYYHDPDFNQIKPYGNIGDRKNDGYNKVKGIYYQVYAPEYIKSSNSYSKIIKKLINDFEGLISQWSPVNEYYFVINDKYKGVYPDVEKNLNEIKTKYNLQKVGLTTAKDLENLLFKLSDDQISQISGFLPDPINITTLDYSIVSEIVEHIISLELPKAYGNNIYPDWDKKIKFNGLTENIDNYLKNGSLLVADLDKYLHNNGSFLSDELAKKTHRLYEIESDNDKTGDDLFWIIVEKLNPKPTFQYESSIIVIMAKYFESCDIFKEPE
ncbi:MAG: ABC-three component system protein [bacterium]